MYVRVRVCLCVGVGVGVAEQLLTTESMKRLLQVITSLLISRVKMRVTSDK